jgi:lysophospholipase L1-like esterase
LLKQGTARRPAKYHLDDPGTRYLLITNADATGMARDLLVRGLEEWPEGQMFQDGLRPEFEIEDGLHLSPAAYAVWTTRLTPLIDGH